MASNNGLGNAGLSSNTCKMCTGTTQNIGSLNDLKYFLQMLNNNIQRILR